MQKKLAAAAAAAAALQTKFHQEIARIYSMAKCPLR